MANIDLGNLTRYDGKIKQHTEDKYLSKNTANWQMTEKAGAVTYYPVPNTELEPIVNFNFKEVFSASGEKSPSNPSVITGISSITVTRCETAGIDETQYVVNLDNTYYGGSVNLATGMMTVTQQGFIFDGSEDWSESSGEFLFNLSPVSNAIWNAYSLQACTHYPLDATGTTEDSFRLSRYYIYIKTSGTLVEFKNFLAIQYANSTPVVATYALLFPYVVQLTPIQIKSLFALDKNTPRLNTLYTDADSIQVGYQKHPARTAYELENAILALGGGE